MRHTFDLDDNPFDPKLPGLNDKIAGEPMPIDRYPDLIATLFCHGIAGVRQAEDDLRYALFGDDPAPEPPVRQSVILLIHGVRGSGRSTLARLVAGWLTARQATELWEAKEVPFDSFQPNPQPTEVRTRFDDLRKSITGVFKDDPGRVLVVVDNLPRDSFGFVVSAFKAFPRLTRVFIVTSDDAALFNSDLAAAGPLIVAVELKKLPPEDVRAFITDRVPHYRGKRVELIKQNPEFALFPFAESAPNTAVSGGAKPLRNVQDWLRGQIEGRHRALNKPGLVDAELATAEDLRARMIP